MAILTLVLLAVVILVISGPLRVQRRERDPLAAERGDLEAAREAKYREIRDAELDYRTGKLSRADYEQVDRTLRAEAVAILDRLQALSPPAGAVPAEAAPAEAAPAEAAPAPAKAEAEAEAEGEGRGKGGAGEGDATPRAS